MVQYALIGLFKAFDEFAAVVALNMALIEIAFAQLFEEGVFGLIESGRRGTILGAVKADELKSSRGFIFGLFEYNVSAEYVVPLQLLFSTL